MAIEVRSWTGGYFSGSGSYLVGGNDHDDMLGVFTTPTRLSRVTISNAAGYFHYHDPGQFGVVMLREANTGTYYEIFRMVMPTGQASGNIFFNTLDMQVPREHQNRLWDGLRFQSQPAVNQGMHDVSSFTVTFDTTVNGEPSRGTVFPYGTSSYGGGAGLVIRGEVLTQVAFSGSSSATFGMNVIRRAGDLTVLPSSPEPEDITLSVPEGPDTHATTPAGVAGASINLGETYSVAMQADGVSTFDNPNINRFLAADDTWHAEGKAALEPHWMYVVEADEFVVIYKSKPPYQGTDVLMAPEEGPVTPRANTSMVGGFAIGQDMIGGDEQNLTESNPNNINSLVRAQAGATASMGITRPFSGNANGKGGAALNRLGAERAVTSTSNGVAATRTLANMLNGWYLSSPILAAVTSNGRAGARNPVNTGNSWYLGSSTRMEVTSNGRGGARDQLGVAGKWYLGSSLRVTSTSAGKAAITYNYASSRVLLSDITSAGKGGAKDQLGNLGRWYLGSNIRAAVVSNGKGGGVNYLASRVFPAWRSSLNAGANVIMYLAGPVSVVIRSNGRATGTIDPEFLTRYMSCRSQGRSTGSLVQFIARNTFPALAMRADSGCRAFHGFRAGSPGALATAGIENWDPHTPGDSNHDYGAGYGYTGVEGVRFYQIGKDYQSIKSAGKAFMIENEEFMPWNFRMRSHAGCNAWPAGDPTEGNILRQYNRSGLTSNQPDARYPDDWIPQSLAGKQMPEDFDDKRVYEITNIKQAWSTGIDTRGRRRGVEIYLSSTMQFDNTHPTNDWKTTGVQHSIIKGRATMTAEFDPQLDMHILAGCRVGGNHYVADDDPALRAQASGTSYRPAGVSMTQDGPTYMVWDDRPTTFFSRPTLVHFQMGVTFQRLGVFEPKGRADVRLRDPNSIFFDGVAGSPFNWINVPSDWQHRWDNHNAWVQRPFNRYPLFDPRNNRPGGQATMFLYAAGRVEMDRLFMRGRAGGINYLQSPVYLEALGNGVSNNSMDGLSNNHYATVLAGCYPYKVVRPASDTEPGGQVDIIPGIKFMQDRVNPSLRTMFQGFSSMEIEIEGVPIIRIRSNGKANWLIDAGFVVDKNYNGFRVTAGSYGFERYYDEYPFPSVGETGYSSMFRGMRYGVSIEQFQERDFQADGVGDFKEPLLGAAYQIVWQTWDGFAYPTVIVGPDGKPRLTGAVGTNRRAGGVTTMRIDDERVFMEARTSVNKGVFSNGRIFYPFYSPPTWHLIADFALKSRARGRARFYPDHVYGNLLHRVHKAPHPGIPNIDGGPTQAHGQFWPRRTVLPWPKIEPTTPNWADYEYARR